MNAIAYVFWSIWDEVHVFWEGWYVGLTRRWWGGFFRVIASFEQSFAVRAHLHNLFKPLRQDYTGVGIGLGIFFRTLRIFSGLVFYVFLFVFAFAGWAIIEIIPLFLIAKGLGLVPRIWISIP